MKYESFFYSNSLQFGFKPGFSVQQPSKMLSLGTCIMVPMSWVVSWMLVRLLTWLIMAFFSRLSLTEVYLLQFKFFLLSWYCTRQMQVRWGDCLSEAFHVSNGVRQGSVLSPLLFSVYLDGLLSELSDCGVGCFWGSLFAGAFCYADDIVLLRVR